jgi:hypothetical protein
MGQFRYWRAFQKEISTGVVHTHFGATQQTG